MITNPEQNRHPCHYKRYYFNSERTPDGCVYPGMPQWSNREAAGTLQAMVIDAQSLTQLDAQELRDMVSGLLAQIAEHTRTITARDTTITAKDRDILYRQTKIDQLTHEMAVLKRWKFGRSREQLDSGPCQLA